MDLDEVADELYEVPPEDFIALRSTRQDEAKAEGDKALAKEIGALPKPSTAAWACNLLVRSHREELEGLVELGGLLREAQENLAGDQLRALSSQRTQLISALTRQAAALARQAGRPVSTAVADQVEETLRAAMADPEAGEALLTGRITSSMSYNGMGTTVSRPDLRLVRPPAPERAPSPQRSAPAKSAPRPSADERRREREREQAEARRAAEEKRKRELAEARRPPRRRPPRPTRRGSPPRTSVSGTTTSTPVGSRSRPGWPSSPTSWPGPRARWPRSSPSSSGPSAGGGAPSTRPPRPWWPGNAPSPASSS